MNDEDADETTRLMSVESATQVNTSQVRDEGRSSRGRRSRRSQNEPNVYTVRPQQKVEN